MVELFYVPRVLFKRKLRGKKISLRYSVKIVTKYKRRFSVVEEW